jgi:hypothetical protein
LSIFISVVGPDRFSMSIGPKQTYLRLYLYLNGSKFAITKELSVRIIWGIPVIDCSAMHQSNLERERERKRERDREI